MYVYLCVCLCVHVYLCVSALGYAIVYSANDLLDPYWYAFCYSSEGHQNATEIYLGPVFIQCGPKLCFLNVQYVCLCVHVCFIYTVCVCVHACIHSVSTLLGVYLIFRFVKMFDELCVQRCSSAYQCCYLCYCHLPVSFDRSGPSPLTSLINNTFLPTELRFFVFLTILSRLLCVEIPGDQQFLRYSNHPVWHQQSFHD